MTALVTFMVTLLAAEDVIWIHNGFLNRDEFRKMPTTEQRAYVMGYVDGLMVSPLLGVEKSKMKWIETLVEGMSSEQITAILLSYLQWNPETWNENNHTITYRASKRGLRKEIR